MKLKWSKELKASTNDKMNRLESTVEKIMNAVIKLVITNGLAPAKFVWYNRIHHNRVIYCSNHEFGTKKMETICSL